MLARGLKEIVMKKKNDIVDCKDCAYQYDCERTYLGCCTDGKNWGEEEKENDENER